MTICSSLAESDSSSVRIRSCESGRGTAVPSSAKAIAVASNGPMRIGRERLPSRSFRMTTGSCVRRSIPSLSTFICRIARYSGGSASDSSETKRRRFRRCHVPCASVALSCGIVGLPNVGKSTIFNALTRSAQALAGDYPVPTIDPNIGEVPVPDPRLGVLARLSRSEKIVPATMRFVDIAGLVRGASSGQGLGNAFLSHIRETDAVAMVVRCFEDANVTHVEGDPDPLRDIEIITIEMSLADLASLTKRRDKLQREVRANPKEAPRLEALDRLIAALEAGRPARAFPHDSPEAAIAREAFLLTAKPVLYVANVGEAQI